MSTGKVVLIAGAAVAGYFVLTRVLGQPANAASAPVSVPPPSGGGGGSIADKLRGFFGTVGAQGGSLVANAYGAGALAPAAGVLGRYGGQDAVTTTLGTLGGFKDIAKGNVTTGVKEVVSNSVVKPITGLVHAIGGLF